MWFCAFSVLASDMRPWSVYAQRVEVKMKFRFQVTIHFRILMIIHCLAPV